MKLKVTRRLACTAQAMRGFQVILLLLYPALITLLPWLMDTDKDTGITTSLAAQQQCQAANS